MKVVIVTGDPKSGHAHYVGLLAKALSSQHEVTVLTPKGQIEDYLKGHIDYQIIEHPQRLLSFKVFKFGRIAKLIKKINPDVVHIKSVPPLVGLALPFLRKYPIVITVDDPEIHPGARGYHILRLASCYMTRKADKLIVHGEALKDILAAKGLNKNKMVVIPHGDYSFFTKWQTMGVKKESAILFFGRIAKYKGLEYLFKAAPNIIQAFPDVKIIIAGRNGFSGITELDSHEKNFEIHNEYVSDNKVAELFQRAKVAVLPYIQASQSGVVHIAYAFKVPVVATKVGAIPEVVEDGVTGYLVPPQDPEALSQAIIKLLSNEQQRIKMGEAAYKKMKRDLSWETIAQKTSQLYQELVKSQV